MTTDNAAQTPAYQVYTAAVEEAGPTNVRRAFRFFGGVLNAALGGRTDIVVGRSIVIRSLADGESHLRIDLPHNQPGDRLLAVIRKDLNEMTDVEFEGAWLHDDHDGHEIPLSSD